MRADLVRTSWLNEKLPQQTMIRYRNLRRRKSGVGGMGGAARALVGQGMAGGFCVDVSERRLV